MKYNQNRNIKVIGNKIRKIASRVSEHFYEYGFAYRFILSKLYAIAVLALGIHLEVAHMKKVLPFGLVYNVAGGLGLWSIWAYTGGFIGLIVMAYGIWRLAPIYVEQLLDAIVRRTHRDIY